MTDLGLADELLELGADDVHVDGHAGVLEGEEADPGRALDEVRAIGGGRSPMNAGERRVADDEPLDDDPVAFDADAGRRNGLGIGVDDGERWVRRGFHGPNLRRAACHLACHDDRALSGGSGSSSADATRMHHDGATWLPCVERAAINCEQGTAGG